MLAVAQYLRDGWIARDILEIYVRVYCKIKPTCDISPHKTIYTAFYADRMIHLLKTIIVEQ